MQHFQIDNQVAQDYAVLLAPRRLADAKPLPFIQFSVNRAASAASSIMLFNYVSLLVQEFDIQVEEPIIWALLELINDLGLAGSAGGGKSGQLQSSASMLALDVNSVLAAPATRATALFFAFLQLQPLAVNLRYAFSVMISFLPPKLGDQCAIAMYSLFKNKIRVEDWQRVSVFHEQLVKHSGGSPHLMMCLFFSVSRRRRRCVAGAAT